MADHCQLRASQQTKTCFVPVKSRFRGKFVNTGNYKDLNKLLFPATISLRESPVDTFIISVTEIEKELSETRTMAVTIVIILMLAITFSSSSTAVAETQGPSSSPPAPTCSEELVMFSPCIPYVSAPPNNISKTPDALCCSVFSTSVHSTAGKCLCYLLRQPMILGFPLDRSRLLSLSQICTEFKSSDESFESLCSPSGLVSNLLIQMESIVLNLRCVTLGILICVLQCRLSFRRFRVSSSRLPLTTVNKQNRF